MSRHLVRRVVPDSDHASIVSKATIPLSMTGKLAATPSLAMTHRKFYRSPFNFPIRTARWT